MTKSIIFLIVLLCSVMHTQFAAAQIAELFSSGPAIETIETEELNQLLTAQQRTEAQAKAAGEEPPKPNFVVVDVRSDAEIKVSLIPGAVTKAAYEKNASEFQGRTVIPYCLSGGRSNAYAEELASKDVPVKNYRGSILAWVGEELPLATPDGKPTKRVHTVSDRYQVPASYEQVTQ